MKAYFTRRILNFYDRYVKIDEILPLCEGIVMMYIQYTASVMDIIIFLRHKANKLLTPETVITIIRNCLAFIRTNDI